MCDNMRRSESEWLVNTLINASAEQSEFRLITGVPSPAPAGSIPDTSTKVSESPDCENPCLEAASRGVWVAFSSGYLRFIKE